MEILSFLLCVAVLVILCVYFLIALLQALHKINKRD